MKANLQSDLFRNLHAIRKACIIPLARKHTFAWCVLMTKWQQRMEIC